MAAGRPRPRLLLRYEAVVLHAVTRARAPAPHIVTGPEFAATVRILPPEEWPWAGKTVKAKYWLARIPFFWSKQNVYLEIEVAL